MYSRSIIDARQAHLERSLGEALPGGRLERLPVETCQSLRRLLDEAWDPAAGAPTRALTQEEQVFVANEQLLTKIDFEYFAERYWLIQAAGQRLKPMYPLFESQKLILAAVAEEEERRHRIKHPDGLIFNILKARQLGASSICEALVGHRVVTHTYVKAIVASDVPENSGSQGIFGMLERGYEHLPWWLRPAAKFHNKDRHLVLANGSSVVVESGKSMKGGLQDEGGTKGNLGRSKTFSVGHLTELSTWERAEQIDDGLMPAIPETPRTLLARESTAKGRHNWWHQEWEIASKGLGRAFNIFIPWYAEKGKYWLPCPEGWTPTDDTLAFALRVKEKGAQYVRAAANLSKEQLYWYAQRKTEAVAKEQLYKFLEEYCLGGSTRVGTQRGMLPIRDVREGDWTSSGQVTRAVPTGTRAVVEVLTEQGRSLIGTPDHRVYLADGTPCELQHLAPGMLLQLAVPATAIPVPSVTWNPLPAYTSRMELTEDWARFLGYFMGDGSYYKDRVDIACDGQDPDVVEDVAETVQRLVGEAPRRKQHRTRCVLVNYTTQRWRPVLLALGLLRQRSSDGAYKRAVRVPEIIYQAPLPLIRVFLSSLFEADGHSYKDAARIGFFAKDQTFVRGVQQLLLACGITSLIRPAQKNLRGKVFGGFSLHLHAEAARKFYAEIGFRSARKQQRHHVTARPWSRGRKPNVLTDRVVSVTPCTEPEAVYDLTIEGSHRFDANGIVVHNCSEPEEAFQFSGHSVFPIAVIDRVEQQARPLLDLWSVKPHSDLRADREKLLLELQHSQRQLGKDLESERLRRAEQVVDGVNPETIRVEPTVHEETPA